MLTSLRDLEKSLANPIADNTVISNAMPESCIRSMASRAQHEETPPPNVFNAGTESSMLNSAFLNSQSSVVPRVNFVQPRVVQGTFFTISHFELNNPHFRSKCTSVGNVYECSFGEPFIDEWPSTTKSCLRLFRLWHNCSTNTACPTIGFQPAATISIPN